MSHPDGALPQAELLELLRELCDDLALWRPAVRHDPDQRVFVQVAVEERYEAWLICWMPGQDTGFHDHDLSSGAVTVLAGEVAEQRLTFEGAGREHRYRGGETFTFGPTDIHRVRHAGELPATTLHVYSPPLRRMGAYRTGDGGALERHPLGYDQELRPLDEEAVGA